MPMVCARKLSTRVAVVFWEKGNWISRYSNLKELKDYFLHRDIDCRLRTSFNLLCTQSFRRIGDRRKRYQF